MSINNNEQSCIGLVFGRLTVTAITAGHGPHILWTCRSTIAEQNVNTRQNHFLDHQGLRLTISQWAERIGIQSGSLQNRIARGWPVERALTEPIR